MVDHRREVEILSGQQAKSEAELLAIPLHQVIFADAVASVGSSLKVGRAQAQVGLV